MADFKSVNIHDVEKRRDAIVERVLRPQFGQAVNPELLAQSIRSILPAGITHDAVFESVRYLAGRTLNDLDSVRLAWRLAGNIPTLRAGIAVVPWAMQRADEWVPLQIIKIHKTRNSKDKLGYDVTSRALAGSPCPLKISSFWSVRVIRLVSIKVGFSRYGGKYPFGVASDLVGLRFYGLIEAARSRGRPEFHEIECSDSMIQWNRDYVLKLRMRVGQKCPAGFHHKCYLCAYGYDRCSAATHPVTFTLGFCAGCNQSDVPFDPEDQSPHCVNCAAIARLRKKSI